MQKTVHLKTVMGTYFKIYLDIFGNESLSKYEQILCFKMLLHIEKRQYGADLIDIKQKKIFHRPELRK